MKNIKAFLKGVIEFRSSFTQSYDNLTELDCYDKGREWAHRLTLRMFEE